MAMFSWTEACPCVRHLCVDIACLRLIPSECVDASLGFATTRLSCSAISPAFYQNPKHGTCTFLPPSEPLQMLLRWLNRHSVKSQRRNSVFSKKQVVLAPSLTVEIRDFVSFGWTLEC